MSKHGVYPTRGIPVDQGRALIQAIVRSVYGQLRIKVLGLPRCKVALYCTEQRRVFRDNDVVVPVKNPAALWVLDSRHTLHGFSGSKKLKADRKGAAGSSNSCRCQRHGSCSCWGPAEVLKMLSRGLLRTHHIEGS